MVIEPHAALDRVVVSVAAGTKIAWLERDGSLASVTLRSDLLEMPRVEVRILRDLGTDVAEIVASHPEMEIIKVCSWQQGEFKGMELPESVGVVWRVVD